MKNLSKYEKFDEPIILRKDLIKDSHGIGYRGSRLRGTGELFKTNPINNESRFKRPQSSLESGRGVSRGGPQGDGNRPLTSYLQQIKGHYQYESTNTLRNSVLPQTIPKAERFKFEQKGSYFAQFKDPLNIAAAGAGASIMSSSKGFVQSVIPEDKKSTIGQEVLPNVSPSNRDQQQFHVKRDNLNIKVDDFIAQGRPLWMRELNVGAPAPNTYKVKTPQQLNLEKIEIKPNKCLFGEPHEKYKRTCDIDPSVKIYDHSKHYASTQMGFYRSDPEITSPMDTLVTRKKNHPVYSMPQSKEILFKHQIKQGRETPGPSDYNQDDQAIRNTRNTKVTIPYGTRPLDQAINLSPGPGSYETENLTNLIKKIESKNQIHQTYSETMSNATKSTKSTSTLSRPTSKYAMLKYYDKNCSSTSQSWFQQIGESSKHQQRNAVNTVSILAQQLKEKYSTRKIQETNRDLINEDLEEEKSPKQGEKALGGHLSEKVRGSSNKKNKAPWKSNQDFIEFINHIDPDHKNKTLSQPNLKNSRTLIGSIKRKKRNQSRLNHATAASTVMVDGKIVNGSAASKLIYLGGNSLKSIPRTSNNQCFTHKDFI